MAGGNNSAMQAMMSGFADGSPSIIGGHGSNAGNPLTEQYKAILKQWIADNERSLIEADSSRLAQIAQGYESMMQDPRLNWQQKNMYMQAMPIMAGSWQTKQGLEGALTAANKLVQFTGEAGVPTNDIKTAQMMREDPSLLNEFNMTHPSNSAQIANDLGLTGPEREQFIRAHAMKSGVNINMGDGRPQLNLLSPEDKQRAGLPSDVPYVLDKNNMPQAISTGNELAVKNKQNFDTMNASLKRIDQIEQIPDFNPADFTDAMIRTLSSGDSSVVGKLLGPMQSPASKLYGTAAAEWVSANRSLLSGAEVPPEEFARDLGIYFAKPNDTKEILAMKAQMRRDRLESLKSIVMLPPAQRAAAWKATGEVDQLKLSNVSTKPVIQEAIGKTKATYEEVLKAWEAEKGSPATQNEKDQIKAHVGE